jgi:LysM repeat protein
MVGNFKHRIVFILKFSVFISFFALLIISCGSAAQSTGSTTSYEGYAVKKGETVRSIARDYNISESVIYNLNPEVKGGKLKANSILILPSTKKEVVIDKDETIKAHTVKRKETLYSISKLYGVSEEDIKKYNRHLISRPLNAGETIYIPIATTGEGIKSPALELPPGIEEYEIVAKDTKFGIAKNHGISVEALEALNPKMGETLEIGYKILVPSKVGEALDTENYDYYEVQPKEGFYRLKKKFGLSEEEIVALNPQAIDGLKDGMILKLPKEGIKGADGDVIVENLEAKITNRAMKNVALLLPFGVSSSEIDSIQREEDLLRTNPTLRIALDFYSGALIAAEFAKERGISVTLSVYDTDRNESKVAAIVSRPDFDHTDAVIGPLFQKNIERVSSMLAKKKTPVFSPLSNREMANLPNLFQTLPTNAILEQTMVKYLKRHATGKNVIIITDPSQHRQKQLVIDAIPTARSLTIGGNYAQRDELMTYLSEHSENWVILASDKPMLISSCVNVLSDLGNHNKIRLFTLNKSEAYEWDEVSNTRLAKLDFTFPSVNKQFMGDKDPFIRRYKEKHGVIPNRFAIRGFDITYDVLLRMASEEDVYDAFPHETETVYVENKFRYEKSGRSGYVNQAAYILKYNNDLNFEVVE